MIGSSFIVTGFYFIITGLSCIHHCCRGSSITGLMHCNAAHVQIHRPSLVLPCFSLLGCLRSWCWLSVDMTLMARLPKLDHPASKASQINAL